MTNTVKSVAFAGAASATLATAVSNYNTAAVTAITAAGNVSGVIASTIQAQAPTTLWDGTNYTIIGSLVYIVAS